jgi:hypothetical protein
MPKKKRKKWTVVGLDKALEAMAPERRAGVAAELEEMFRNFDPKNAQGERVERVDPGTRVCPRCGGPLEELALLPRPDGQHELILECDACDATFSELVEQKPS